jgi:hypothetical protein
VGNFASRLIATLAITSTLGCDGGASGPIFTGNMPQPLPPEYACYVGPKSAAPSEVGFETVVLAPDTKPLLLLPGIMVSVVDTTHENRSLATVHTDSQGQAQLVFSTDSVEPQPYALAARYTAGNTRFPTYRYFGFPVAPEIRFGVGMYSAITLDDAYSIVGVSRRPGMGTLLIRIDSCTDAQAIGAVLHMTPAPEIVITDNELLKLDPQTRATSGAVAYNMPTGPVEIAVEVGGTPILDLHLTIQPDAITVLSTLN